MGAPTPTPGGGLTGPSPFAGGACPTGGCCGPVYINGLIAGKGAQRHSEGSVDERM
jgi:hypothetical protein